MNRLFIFGIGGTGARVIRSLILLLGTGVKINADEIIPIILDPDSSNGDMNRTLDLLNIYKNISSLLPKKENGFFHTKISTLGKGNSELDDFQFRLEKIQNLKFRDYISYHSLSDKNKYFMDLLFSENNLNLEMQVGFKGNPNIGSIVLNQFKNSIDFKAFANNFSKGDRIFIISSIFGGTGASGFPLLIKNIRNAEKEIPNHALIKDAKIGAISVLPYFGLMQEEKSVIEKESFLPKTKSALDYYEKNINSSLDAMYYIGDNISKDYSNHEGQASQKNDAHFVELASALSIIDFMDKTDSELQRGANFKEFGIRVDTDDLTFDSLGKKTRDTILFPLSSYMFFIKYLELKLSYAIKRKQTWTIEGEKKIDENFLSLPFYKNYLTSFNNYFIEWLKELGNNNRSFQPFNLKVSEKNLFSLIRGLKEKTGIFKRKNFDAFDTELNDYVRHISNELSREEKFLNLFENATKNLNQNKYEIGVPNA